MALPIGRRTSFVLSAWPGLAAFSDPNIPYPNPTPPIWLDLNRVSNKKKSINLLTSLSINHSPTLDDVKLVNYKHS